MTISVPVGNQRVYMVIMRKISNIDFTKICDKKDRKKTRICVGSKGV